MWRGGRHPLGRALHAAGLRVDDFEVPGRLYLLSHFHSDHTRGLSRRDPGAPVVTSPETALLAARLHRVPEERFLLIRGGETIDLESPTRLRVTAIDANHCPGALMFLVESEWGRLLYTGDFRLDETMRAAVRALPPVDLLVADNTYDHPRYRFPRQEVAIDEVVAIAERHVRERQVAIAVYTIGKTRILRALRERLGLPTYVGEPTARAYGVLGLADIVTRDRDSTPLRGYARGYFERYFKMRREYREGRTIAIIPTGWAVDVLRPEWNFHYVPYSEHCDFHEREEFVASVRPAAVEDLLEPAGAGRRHTGAPSAPSGTPAIF